MCCVHIISSVVKGILWEQVEESVGSVYLSVFFKSRKIPRVTGNDIYSHVI